MEQGKKMALKRIIFCIILLCIKPITRLTITIAGDNDIKYLSCIDIALKDDLSKYKLDTTTNSSGGGSNNSSNNPGGSSNRVVTSENEKDKDTETIEYKLDKNFVVIAHYHGFKISKYKIKILNSKGKKMKNSKFDFKIDKPIATIDDAGEVEAQFGGKATITVSPKTNPSNKQTIDLRVVHGTYVKASTNKKLKVKNLQTGEKETLPKGTEGIYNGSAIEFKSGAGPKKYYHGDTLRVGKNYYKVSYQNVNRKKYYITDTYDKEVVEEFVNFNEFKSDTKYLFWTNLGTEENYVLKGKKGKWKLYKIFDINTGDVLGINASWANGGDCNGTSASSGGWAHGLGACDSVYGSVITRWLVGDKMNGTGEWPAANKHYALYKKSADGAYDNWWHEGYKDPREPMSHGCIRHRTEDLQWVFNNFSKVYGSQIVQF